MDFILRLHSPPEPRGRTDLALRVAHVLTDCRRATARRRRAAGDVAFAAASERGLGVDVAEVERAAQEPAAGHRTAQPVAAVVAVARRGASPARRESAYVV